MSFRNMLATAACVLALGVPDLLAGQQCNPCHYCADLESVYIGDPIGASTVNILSPPTSDKDCEVKCSDFGHECDPPFMQAVNDLAQAVLRGRVPSVNSFAEAHPSFVRSIPARGMVVVLSPCDQSWLLAFPARPEEMRGLTAIATGLQAG
jgi:hypothetical protein